MNPVTDPKPEEPIKILDEPVPMPLDWPHLDTIPSELDDGDGCPWKQSGFL